MPSTLSVDRDGRVMTIRIDNPPHNFMNRRMIAELDEVTTGLEGDDSIGAVIITGANDGLFITHYDVAEILRGSETMDRTVGAASRVRRCARSAASRRCRAGAPSPPAPRRVESSS